MRAVSRAIKAKLIAIWCLRRVLTQISAFKWKSKSAIFMGKWRSSSRWRVRTLSRLLAVSTISERVDLSPRSLWSLWVRWRFLRTRRSCLIRVRYNRFIILIRIWHRMNNLSKIECCTLKIKCLIKFWRESHLSKMWIWVKSSNFWDGPNQLC